MGSCCIDCGLQSSECLVDSLLYLVITNKYYCPIDLSCVNSIFSYMVLFEELLNAHGT